MSETRKHPRIRPWHWWTGLGVLLIALIAGAWCQRQPPPEPIYDGVPLSVLLKGEPLSDGRQAYQILESEMGADGLPYLTWRVKYGRHELNKNSFSLVRLIQETILREPP